MSQKVDPRSQVPESPTIGPDVLAGMLESGSPVVVCDVRFSLADHAKGRRDYDEAHLPGARFVDLHHELSDQTVTGRGRHPLPTTASFADLLRRLGITPSTFVVAYDDAGGAFAARLWWMLRSVGHRRAAVLEGGIAAWRDAGLPLTDRTDQEVAAPTDVAAYQVPTVWTGTVDADQVAAAISTSSATVVDSRAADRYRGENEPIDPQAGHIPGAVNMFHGANVDATGRFLPSSELATRFSSLGASPIVYCGSGVTACHNILAMAIAGLEDVRLYPGSWSEWSSDPTRPVTTGV